MADFWELLLVSILTIAGWIVGFASALVVTKRQLAYEGKERALSETNERIYYPLRKQVLRITQEERCLVEGTVVYGLDANFSPVQQEGRLLIPVHKELRADLEALTIAGNAHTAASVDYANSRGDLAGKSAGALHFTPFDLIEDEPEGRQVPIYGEMHDLQWLATEANTVIDAYKLGAALHKRDFGSWKEALVANANGMAGLLKADRMAPPSEADLRGVFEKTIETLAPKRALYETTGRALVAQAGAILSNLNQALTDGTYYRRTSG